ncbi:hypothetical protein FGADI_2384 [Fusarium gaditjirri]|uniref:WSC domain-containing protein n=1 Tax=Fusarium gaditjirri TaxID=282569 RepID=A0A8H4TID2_9HYPO|nr:hypothetical protein FGADI_2384 [Fusarium gaditjirri]
MRISSGLLLASASSVLRQFQQGFSFYPPPDGNSIPMSLVPSDGSSIARRQVLSPAFTRPNSPITFVNFNVIRFPVLTGPIFLIVNLDGSCICSAKRVKRDVPRAFKVLVDDEVVLEEPINPKSGSLDLSTNPFPKYYGYKFTFQQVCGNQIVPVILNCVTVKDGPDAVSTPVSSIFIGTRSSVETSTATTESATQTNVIEVVKPEGETVNITKGTGTASSDVLVSLLASLPLLLSRPASQWISTSAAIFAMAVPTLVSTCYCGDELGNDGSRVNLDECNIACPGNDTEFCGDDSSKKRRARQAVPSSRLLMVYAAPQDITWSVTQTVTEEQNLITTVTGASAAVIEAIITTLNSWGTPDKCNIHVPTCSGYNCPSKHQSVTPHGGSWSSNSTVPNGGCNGGSEDSGSGTNPSANGGSSSGSNAAPGSGVASPSTLSVSSASKQAMSTLAFLVVFIALLETIVCSKG